jgi:hypothetical protein
LATGGRFRYEEPMRLALSAALSLSLLACGQAAEAPPPKMAPAARATEPGPSDPGEGKLRRSQVKGVVGQGLGAFLQNVSVDDRPVFLGGKFHGFRITQLRGELAASPLRPGDVVTRVNGMPIERPEQALEAFRTLEVSSELRIAYEREGDVRELKYAIVEDAPASK